VFAILGLAQTGPQIMPRNDVRLIESKRLGVARAFSMPRHLRALWNTDVTTVMPYVRVKTSARHSLRLRRVSDSAKAAWWASLALAEECACKGALIGSFAHENLGLMTLVEIADDLHIPERTIAKIAEELCAVDLWNHGNDGSYRVSKFEEETTPVDPRAAERVRRFRDRKRSGNAVSVTHVTALPSVTVTESNAVTKRYGNGNVTFPVTPPVTAQKREIELESNLASLGYVAREETPLQSVTVTPLQAVTEPAPDSPEAALSRSYSPEVALAHWFVTTGVELGGIPAHVGLDVTAAALKQSLDDAKALLTSYGRDEVEQRARRFFAAVKAHKIRRTPSISSLAAAWDWDVIAGVLAPSESPAKTPAMSETGRRLSEQYARVAAEKKVAKEAAKEADEAAK